MAVLNRARSCGKPCISQAVLSHSPRWCVLPPTRTASVGNPRSAGLELSVRTPLCGVAAEDGGKTAKPVRARSGPSTRPHGRFSSVAPVGRLPLLRSLRIGPAVSVSLFFFFPCQSVITLRELGRDGIVPGRDREDTGAPARQFFPLRPGGDTSGHRPGQHRLAIHAAPGWSFPCAG